MIINESNDITRIIRLGDKDKLTKYLASLGDGAEVVDPKDKSIVYHKASNGVKSGWGERHNGKRVNVTLWKDDQVAKYLLHESVGNMFSIDPKSVKYPSGSASGEVLKIITDYFTKNKSFLSGSGIRTSFGSVQISITHTKNDSYPSFSLVGFGTIVDPDDNSVISKDYPIAKTSVVNLSDMKDAPSVVKKQLAILDKLMKKAVKEDRITDYRDQ